MRSQTGSNRHMTNNLWDILLSKVPSPPSTDLQRILIVNDSVTASFLLLIVIVNHSTLTENVLVKLNDSFTQLLSV